MAVIATATDHLIEAVAALTAAARRPGADCSILFDLADESIASAVALMDANRAAPALEQGDVVPDFYGDSL
jgi:hypothetical protein